MCVCCVCVWWSLSPSFLRGWSPSKCSQDPLKTKHLRVCVYFLGSTGDLERRVACVCACMLCAVRARACLPYYASPPPFLLFSVRLVISLSPTHYHYPYVSFCIVLNLGNAILSIVVTQSIVPKRVFLADLSPPPFFFFPKLCRRGLWNVFRVEYECARTNTEKLDKSSMELI